MNLFRLGNAGGLHRGNRGKLDVPKSNHHFALSAVLDYSVVLARWAAVLREKNRFSFFPKPLKRLTAYGHLYHWAKAAVLWKGPKADLRLIPRLEPFNVLTFLAAVILFTTITRAPAQMDTMNAPRTFAVKGVILKIEPGEDNVLIQNEAISNYMEAMTMPFPLKTPGAVAGLRRGDKVEFQLHVAEDNSWADHFLKIGVVTLGAAKTPVKPAPVVAPTERGPRNPLLDYKFTNELGQAVSLNDFRGQALAITFFYTRCPLPEFCPRLSRNFQEASEKLEAMTNGPANWHFISVSFDPKFDTPEALRNYGNSYHYDPAHWSFLTGPPDKIAELAHDSGVEYEESAGTINHNFRTLIVNAQGHLQMVFPTSGDLSDQIVSEIVKAAKVQPPVSVARH